MDNACSAADVWKNNSYPHFGIPSTLTIIPQVRIQGQVSDLPPGLRIPACNLETQALYQSGALVASASSLSFVKLQELVIPAKAVVGGERFQNAFGLAIQQRATTATATVTLKITNQGETVTDSQTILSIAVPTSGGTDYANGTLLMYYDAVAGKMKVLGDLRNDTTYSRTVFTDMNFDPTIIQKIQIGVTMSAIAASQSVDVEFLTMGRIN